MVYLENIKVEDGFIVKIDVSLPSREETIEAPITTKDILTLELEEIKNKVRPLIDSLGVQDRCKIINHVVASVNDFKRKTKYE